MVKIAVSGACGRMGKRIINSAEADNDVKVVFGLESKDHPDAGKIVDGIKIESDLGSGDYDCLIDFSAPLATVEHVVEVADAGKSVVIGTTGLDQSQQHKIRQAAEKIPLVFSPATAVVLPLSSGVSVTRRYRPDTGKDLAQYSLRSI